MNKGIVLFLFLVSSYGCSSNDSLALGDKKRYETVETLSEAVHDQEFMISRAIMNKNKPYPWDSQYVAEYPAITKDFFRCKGDPFNLVRTEVDEVKGTEMFTDCKGGMAHSLPLKAGRGFIYPILVDVLNYIQEKTKKRVVITSGHRCPKHNTYINSSLYNSTSKHMIGAEVNFYVEGLENSPERVVQAILDYYQEKEEFRSQPSYREFRRYQKDDTNVSNYPWYNKELFVKLFNREEGRDFDNQHPFPYIAIQVRYDPETKARVVYTWSQAYKGYVHW